MHDHDRPLTPIPQTPHTTHDERNRRTLHGHAVPAMGAVPHQRPLRALLYGGGLALPGKHQRKTKTRHPFTLLDSTGRLMDR